MKSTSAAALSPSTSPPTREEIIAQSLPLVRSIATRLRKAYNFPIPLDDLCSVGLTGLLEAADRFDPKRGVAFTTFAFRRVRGAIFDLQRTEPANAIHIQERRTAPAAAARVLQLSSVGREIGDEQAPSIASGRSTTFEKIGSLEFVPFYKLDQIVDEEAPHPDEEIERRRRAERVRAAIDALPELERRVLQLRYYEDKSFGEIAVAIGKAKPWMFRIHNRAVRLLRQALGPMNPNADPAIAGGEE